MDKTHENKPSEIALTFTITDHKVVVSYGAGWGAYFHHKDYEGFTEIVSAVEGKLQAYKTNISKKGTGKSYGKKENH